MRELDIRYIKLHFTLTMTENTVLPASKASGLRGGIGEMLLRANCIRDRECDNCDFRSECIVQRTMYSSFDRKPEFITTGDSAGYVIECENYQEKFQAGDELSFNLILFGKTIVYFSQYMQAIAALGQSGLGRNASRFYISRVLNTRSESILSGNNVYMENYRVERLSDYVEHRMRKLKASNMSNEIIFKTPLTQKYRGEMLNEFNMDAIVESVKRRIYILDCFENIDGENLYRREFDVPKILSSSVRSISTRRYSNRHEQAMYQRGIKGEILLDDISDELLELLIAGEVLHIGKNTSFGYGRYYIR